MASEVDELAAAFAKFDFNGLLPSRVAKMRAAYAEGVARDQFDEAAGRPRHHDSDVGELLVMSAPGDKRDSDHPDEEDGAPSWYELVDRRVHLESRACRPVESDFTWAAWRRLLEAFGWGCAYCGKRDDLDQDHVTSIAKGGEDLMCNILPACHACNVHKGQRPLGQWLQSRGAAFSAQAVQRIVAGLERCRAGTREQ